MGKDDKSWGYASYDVDHPDDERLTYTRYESSGSVNRYTDNGNGGHSHDYCVTAIENGEYEKAYNRYKNSILSFEEAFIKNGLQEGLLRVLRNRALQLEES